MAEKAERKPPAKAVRFSLRLWGKICRRLAEGDSLRDVASARNMPSVTTIMRWLDDDTKPDEIREQYARARKLQAETIFDEMLDIADDARNDWMEREGEDAVGYQFMGENVQRSRLRIDTRKWVVSKLNPKKYNDKMVLAGDEEAPLQVTAVERIIVPSPDKNR